MELIVTGFGPFGSFTKNPASEVGKMVADLLKSKCKIKFVEIQTSIQDVDEFYANIKKGNTFVIHIGLYSGIDIPQIETQAANWMNFSIPDQRGNTPIDEKIDKNMEFGECLPQCFDFSKILPNDMKINYSTDAGDFICNYSFFLALKNVGVKTRGATFIHIPHSRDYPIEKSANTIAQIATKILENQNLFK